MSIAGGLHRAVERAVEAGCDTLQVFVRNQRQWAAPPLQEADVRAWRQALDATRLDPVIAHDSYLINLAAPDERIRHRSVDAFVDELERCERLGIAGLVTHPGSHNGTGEKAGIGRIVRSLNTIHRRTRGFRTTTLLETTAGQGTNIGHRFEHLAAILARVAEPERIAVCLDTCHVFAAGYDLVSETGYAATIDALEHHIGLGRIRCFHVNDSKKPLGSRVDRHAHIGQGAMGRDAFRHLVTDPRFFGVPMILETPKGEDARGRDLDRVNLSTLRRLVRRPASKVAS